MGNVDAVARTRIRCHDDACVRSTPQRRAAARGDVCASGYPAVTLDTQAAASPTYLHPRAEFARDGTAEACGKPARKHQLGPGDFVHAGRSDNSPPLQYGRFFHVATEATPGHQAREGHGITTDIEYRTSAKLARKES